MSVELKSPAVDRWEDHRINCEVCFNDWFCPFGALLILAVKEERDARRVGPRRRRL